MDTSMSLRFDANQRQWGGNSSPQSEKQNRRKQKLDVLLQCINDGNLDAARQAFVALVNFDPSVSDDPYLKKIGTALQSTNLYSAKHFAQELQKLGCQLQSHPAETRGLKQLDEGFTAQYTYSVNRKVDLSA